MNFFTASESKRTWFHDNIWAPWKENREARLLTDAETTVVKSASFLHDYLVGEDKQTEAEWVTLLDSMKVRHPLGKAPQRAEITVNRNACIIVFVDESHETACSRTGHLQSERL